MFKSPADGNPEARVGVVNSGKGFTKAEASKRQSASPSPQESSRIVLISASHTRQRSKIGPSDQYRSLALRFPPKRY